MFLPLSDFFLFFLQHHLKGSTKSKLMKEISANKWSNAFMLHGGLAVIPLTFLNHAHRYQVKQYKRTQLFHVPVQIETDKKVKLTHILGFSKQKNKQKTCTHDMTMHWFSFSLASCVCVKYLTSWLKKCDLSWNASSACSSWLTHSFPADEPLRCRTSRSLYGPDTPGRQSAVRQCWTVCESLPH